MSSRPAKNEIEAKLLAPDEATLSAIASCATIGRFRLQDAGRSHLQSTYVDTADRRLLDHKIALRVRQKPSGWEMTAKWAGSVRGDVHTRREINVDLPDPPEMRLAIPPGPLRDELAPVIGDRPLEALATTTIDRRLVLVWEDSGSPVAELALDIVQHSAPGSSVTCVPYYEVEVELMRGDRSVIAELAALLRASYPLHGTGATKFSRALAELYGLESFPNAKGTE